MTLYRFELAQENDEEMLREVLRKTSMQGSICLLFEREPDYFLAERIGNVRTQVIIVRDTVSRNIVGCASRAIRKAYVDEQLTTIGYLGGLRGLPAVRGGTLLARGYRFLRSLHEDGQVPFYITAILDENILAENVLTDARAGLPVYVPLGTLITGLIPLVRIPRRPKIQQHVVRVTQSAHTISDVVSVINMYNQQLQYSPYYAEDDFQDNVRLRDFSLENMYIYSEKGQILGTVGIWDQFSFKQTIVSSYSTALSCMRPLYNTYAKLRAIPQLPPHGSYIRNLYGSFTSVKDDNPEVFHSLLDTVRQDWSERGYSYLAIGFHENHPLAQMLVNYSARVLKSILYLVYWPHNRQTFELPQNIVPHVEIATL